MLTLRSINFKRRLEYIRDAFLGGVYSTGSNGIHYDHSRSSFTSTSWVQVYRAKVKKCEQMLLFIAIHY